MSQNFEANSSDISSPTVVQRFTEKDQESLNMTESQLIKNMNEEINTLQIDRILTNYQEDGKVDNNLQEPYLLTDKNIADKVEPIYQALNFQLQKDSSVSREANVQKEQLLPEDNMIKTPNSFSRGLLKLPL
jgi:hypothetical protein